MTSPESVKRSGGPLRRADRSASPGPDRQDQHVSRVLDPAYAPYNSVPLNKKVVEINTPPPMDKYCGERNTAWIDLEIEAITPLYIRGTLTKKEVEEGLESKDKPGLCAPVERLRIPGSSLRGMTRNMVEMTSFGKFPFSADFADRRLYYRGLADLSSLRGKYQRRMSASDRRSGGTLSHFSAGILRKSGKRERGVHYEIRSSGSNFGQVFKSEAQEWVREIGEKYREFNSYRFDGGFLVVSGGFW